MPTFALRLVEEITERGHGDFAVEADTPEAAAAILEASYRQARDAGSNLVVLPDGQQQFIEREAAAAPTVSFVLLDGDGLPGAPVSPRDPDEGAP